MDAKLLAIYKKTNFYVQDLGGKLVRFTYKTARHFPFFKVKKFAVITAWNPGAQVISKKENRKRNAQLYKDLKKGGYPFYKTRGHWRRHYEESFTVEKISKVKALALGRKYGQKAVTYHDARGVQFLWC
jgi:hypothetical protein